MRADLLEILVREKLGLPPEWTAFRWECLPLVSAETTSYVVEGAIQTGYHKWDRRKKHVTLELSVAEADALALAWEMRTGYCPACMGRGEEAASWSVTDGTTWRECGSCSGSGQSPDFPQTPPVRWVETEPLFAKPGECKVEGPRSEKPTIASIQARVRELEEDRDALLEAAENPFRRARRELLQFVGAWVG